MSMNGGNMYPAKEGKPEIYYSVKAQRGGELRCKGWKQETILRMLENNMENAEIPEQLLSMAETENAQETGNPTMQSFSP